MKTGTTLACLLAVLGCFLFLNQAAAEPVGRVIAVTPGAFAERGGETIALDLKSPVHSADTLVTDATGKLQVLFDDDSSVTLAQGTRIALAAVAPGGDAPVFRAHMGEGLARFITGKTVERNPEGFSIMTPESTIGIRGTIFAVRRDANAAKTSVFVLNTARQVIVNDTTVPAGHKLTLPYGQVLPMAPEDFRTVDAAVSARPAPLATQDVAAQTAPAAIQLLERPDLPVPSTGLASSVLLAQDPDGGGSLANSVTGSSSMTGAVSGVLSGGGITGTFSFNADLGSGSISGASMQGSGGNTSFGFSGGNGYINSSRFGVNTFPTGSFSVGGVSQPGAYGKIYGDVTLSGSGLNVDGEFRVGAGATNINGSLSGSGK